MFRFRSKSHGPFHDAQSLRRWLVALPANDSLAVQREVAAELAKLADRTAHRTPLGLEALFIVDRKTHGAVRELIRQYVDHSSRSAKLEEQLWQALFDLTQLFLACYSAFARELADHSQHTKWQVLLPELTARQIAWLGLDARIRLFRCEPWIPAKWAELHAIFGRACSLKLDRRPLILSTRRGETTIEREYVAVLLFLLAEPGNLTPKQLEWTYAQLYEWSLPMRMTVEARAASTFYIDLDGTAGLKRRGLGTLDGRVLFVDTRALHTQLARKQVELAEAADAEPQSEKAPRQREQAKLFGVLASRVNAEFKPIARSGERVPTSAIVDAIIGLHNITSYLREENTTVGVPRSPGRSYANTMDLAVFGRTRAEPDNRSEYARRRLAAFAAPGGPWEMKDRSVSGFRLHAPMSVATEVTLGMLVAINPEADLWVVGLIRRMRRLSANRAEIGLELIDDAPVSADLTEQRPPGEIRYTLDADPALAPRKFRGLYVRHRKRGAEPSTPSLLVPPVEYQPERRYLLKLPGSARPIQYGAMLEQHADWVWSLLEPVESDASQIAPAA